MPEEFIPAAGDDLLPRTRFMKLKPNALRVISLN